MINHCRPHKEKNKKQRTKEEKYSKNLSGFILKIKLVNFTGHTFSAKYSSKDNIKLLDRDYGTLQKWL